MPALRDAGLDVSFFHEADEPKGRRLIDPGGGAPSSTSRLEGADAALDALAKWKPDLVYAHGLHSVDTATRLLALAPSVTFVHTYVGTCISGTKTHLRPHPIACSRKFGPACLALYFPRRCGGNSPLTMMKLYGVQRQRHADAEQAGCRRDTQRAHEERARAHGIAASVISYPISMSASDTSGPRDAHDDLLFAGRMDKLKGGMLLLDALPQHRRGARSSAACVAVG